MTEPTRTVRCPTCSAPVAATPPDRWFPFCTERCKLVDLGRWMSGHYAIDPATGSIDIIDPDEAEDVTDELTEH